MAIKRTLITIPKITEDQISQIKERKAFQSLSELIRICIDEYHEKLFKYEAKKYIPLTPDQKAKNALLSAKSKLEAKKQDEESDGLDLVYRLGGRITTDNAGNKTCIYNNYAIIGGKVQTFEQQVPIEFLCEQNVLSQYDPTKEKIQAILDKTE